MKVQIANRRESGMWWRAILIVVFWALYATPIVGGVVVVSVLRSWIADVPRTPDLDRWEARVPRSSVILARDGTVLADLPFRKDEEVGHRQLVTYQELPERLVQAVLAAEDIRYFEHTGVDIRAVARAAYANYRAGRVVEGASTIPQQVARNILPKAIGSERKFRRKVREAVMARRLSRRYSKEKLLETYLNHVFLGANAYGVFAAAKAYFNKELRELTVAETAVIAGLAQAPGRASPMRDRNAATARRNEVLGRMRRAGFITAEEHDTAKNSEIVLTPAPKTYGTLAPWAMEHARREVRQRWPEAYERGGLTIETAVDPLLATKAQELAQQHTESLLDEEGNAPEVAALLVDRRTGYVRVAIGGNDWEKSQFDRVTQACRQPGSVFKPIVYGAALEKDVITPGTPLRDGPITVYDERWNTFWKPTNSGRSFRGVALAHDALVSSLNAPAVDVLDRVGAPAVIRLAKRFGVTTKMADVRPLALGSSCVFPLELTNVYLSIANEGKRIPARFITRIRRGEHVFFDERSEQDPTLRFRDRLERVLAAPPQHALDPGTAFMLTNMLADVVQRGTARDARKMKPPVAGKTGTTNGNTDAWFMGFSGQTVAAVWIGHDDPARPLGRKRDGAHAALPLWMKLMSLADQSRPEAPLLSAPPDDLVEVTVDRETGFLAAGGGLSLYFREGTEPTRRANAAPDADAGLHDALRDF